MNSNEKTQTYYGEKKKTRVRIKNSLLILKGINKIFNTIIYFLFIFFFIPKYCQQ